MAATAETGGDSSEREDIRGAILEATGYIGNHRVALLSGGVGGARMARALASVLGPASLTVIVNVGDDAVVYGTHVSADVDTVVYTLAGLEGPAGWGIRHDGFTVMDHLAKLGVDTTFRLGDRDLATCLYRTSALRQGEPLSSVTARIAASLGVPYPVLPATDEPLRTKVAVGSGEWLDFQDYFVMRGHRDRVTDLRFEGAEAAQPAPGVIDALAAADLVVIAPSNPPLSVWPILAVAALRRAVTTHQRVIAVSPLFAGKPLKGPADAVMAGLGLPPGNAGVLTAYAGLLTHLIVDEGDGSDVIELSERGVAILPADTRLDGERGRRFASWLLDAVTP